MESARNIIFSEFVGRDTRNVEMAHDCMDRALLRLAEAGYVIVPKEPTPEMIEAGDGAIDWDSSDVNGSWYVHYSDGDARKSWEAMIEVAVTPTDREDK